MSDNKMYDFRCGLSDATGVVQNNATLDGNFGIMLDSVSSKRSVFGVHNEGVVPTFGGTTAELFETGFDTILQSGGTATDFVLNEVVPFTGSSLTADTELETIPFSLSWTPNSTDMTVDFQWRPDPALYLAIMAGLVEVEYTQVDLDSSAPDLVVNIAFTISGWKSIMSDGKKKTRKSSPRRRTSNRRSRSKK